MIRVGGGLGCHAFISLVSIPPGPRVLALDLDLVEGERVAFCSEREREMERYDSSGDDAVVWLLSSVQCKHHRTAVSSQYTQVGGSLVVHVRGTE